MAERDFDAVFYVKKAPTIRCEGGMFTVCYTIGRTQIEIAMQPSIWQQTRDEADRADRAFHDGKASVSQLRREKADPAH